MILQTAFFRFRSVLACWLLVAGSIVQSNQQPTTHNQQSITDNQQLQKMLCNEVIAIFCIVFNGC